MRATAWVAMVALAGVSNVGAQPIEAMALQRLYQTQINAERSIAEQAVAAERPTPKAANLTCTLPSPFPAGPEAGDVQGALVGIRGNEQFSALFWRWVCPVDPTMNQVFVRITPTVGSPFVCSSSFEVVANAAQYDVRLTATKDGSSFCSDLLVPTTFLVTNWSSDPAYDRNAAMTVVYDGYPAKASTALTAYAPSIVPVAGLWWNPAESGTGYSINLHNGTLVVVTFSFLRDGAAEWYFSVGPLTNSGKNYAATLDKYRGGQCISCPYAGDPKEAGNDGAMKITFTGSSTATMTLPGGRTISIVPQVW